MQQALPSALTIAGSDSGGNAGIQADLLTFAANRVHGTSAITCLTSQNPEGIRSVQSSSGEFVRDQIDQICEYYKPKAAKTGMLFNAEIVESILSSIAKYEDLKLVVDPVMVSSSGERLLDENAIDHIKTGLLPRAILITPNLDEAEVLLSTKIRDIEAMKEAALALAEKYQTSVLLKGGHLEGDELIDLLKVPGQRVIEYHQERIHKIDTHGSGCTLSAAITAHLANGLSVENAVAQGREYLRRGMEQAIELNGRLFINHSPA